jgi:hypothetical protein
MKKKIVLVDKDLELVESVYRSKKVSIEFLIVGSDEQVIEANKLYDIKNIISVKNLNKNISQEANDIDYDVIEKFWKTQLDSEHYYSRFSNDVNLIQYYYFNALFFWIKALNKNNISAVIVASVEHGANHDSVILAAAKYQNIHGYIMNVFSTKPLVGNVGSIRSYSILDYMSKKNIRLDHKKLELSEIDFDSYLQISYLTFHTCFLSSSANLFYLFSTGY